MRRNAYRWAAVSVGVLLWTASAGAAQTAGIGWKKAGPFQTCLDAEFKGWLDAKVVLVVNDDPAAGKINDTAVATWVAKTLKGCATKAGKAADAGSGEQFMKYMTHWREHIFKAAEEIRSRSRPD